MAHLVPIGNSQGVRIPKAFIEQAHLSGKELSLKVVNDGLLITPLQKARDQWKEKIELSISKNGVEPIDNEWLGENLTSDDDWEW